MSEHAISNARGWLSTIVGAMAALEALNDGAESAEFDGETFTDPDDVQQRIHEMPLSVEVRDGWRAPGGESEPEEFAILLSTGGPALRVYGEISDGDGLLQWQDWARRGPPITTPPRPKTRRCAPLSGCSISANKGGAARPLFFVR